MAAHSSILAWEIPWTEEPGGLQSMGLQSQTRLSMRAQTSSHDHAGAAAILVRSRFLYMIKVLCFLFYCKLSVGEILSLPCLFNSSFL